MSDWMRGIEEAGKRKAEERAEWNAKLPAPAVFIPDENDSRFGIGYWKAEGGVIAYRKYANGYDPMSRMEYTNEFIDLLNKVRF